jgi:hypothetical protein
MGLLIHLSRFAQADVTVLPIIKILIEQMHSDYQDEYFLIKLNSVRSMWCRIRLDLLRSEQPTVSDGNLIGSLLDLINIKSTDDLFR